MKKISVVLIAALVVSLLFGCGKSDDAKGTGKTTLSVWYWGEQEVPGYKAYMEEMVKRYVKKNPDIKVEAVLQESDNLYTAFRTAEAAGEGPDIQYMWGGTQAMEDVWKGNVAPISDYISEEELSVIPKSALAQTNWNGKQWGIPAYGFTYGIAYDKEAMRTAGVDPENPFTTWDEFLECCEKLKSSGITPLGMGLKDGYLPAWIGIFLGQQNIPAGLAPCGVVFRPAKGGGIDHAGSPAAQHAERRFRHRAARRRILVIGAVEHGTSLCCDGSGGQERERDFGAVGVQAGGRVRQCPAHAHDHTQGHHSRPAQDHTSGSSAAPPS